MNIVLFDGICNLCSSTISLIIKYDKHEQLHFVALQNLTAINIIKQYNIMDDSRSIIFLKGDKVFYKSDAMIEIAKLLTGWPRVFRFFIFLPEVLRNFIYSMIAKNRYQLFGKRQSCFTPSKRDINRLPTD